MKLFRLHRRPQKHWQRLGPWYLRRFWAQLWSRLWLFRRNAEQRALVHSQRLTRRSRQLDHNYRLALSLLGSSSETGCLDGIKIYEPHLHLIEQLADRECAHFARKLEWPNDIKSSLPTWQCQVIKIMIINFFTYFWVYCLWIQGHWTRDKILVSLLFVKSGNELKKHRNVKSEE